MQLAPPCSAPACWWWMRASGLLLRWELQLGAVFYGLPPPPSYGAIWDSKTPHRPASERVSWCLETFPAWDGSLSLTLLSVFFLVFYILSYVLLKRMGCRSGCPMSSTSIQKLFCGSCSAFKWSFDEFVEEKVVSPSYSSTILGLLPPRPPPPFIPFYKTNFLVRVSVPHIHSHTDFNIKFRKLKSDPIISCAKMNNDSPELSNKNPSSLIWHYFCCVVAKLCLTLWQPHGLQSTRPSLSMGFSRQKYLNRLPFPSPGDLPVPGIEPVSPELADGLFTTEPPWKPLDWH